MDTDGRPLDSWWQKPYCDQSPATNLLG